MKDAWRLSWERKSLWVFGIFAALVSTGGVIDIAWRSVQNASRSQSLLTQLTESSFFGYALASSYIQQFLLLGPTQMTIMVVIISLLGILLAVMAILSQGALILGVKTKSSKNPYALRKEAGTHFWSLLGIALLNKVSMGLIFLLLTLTFWLISISVTAGHGVLFVCLLLLLIPLSVIVNIIYMLSLIHIVHKDSSVLEALEQACSLFKKQWLATFEFGITLFIAVFSAGLATIGILALLLVPYSIVFTSVVLTGSLNLFLFVNILSLSLLFIILFTFIGAAVTFQYSAWYAFYKRGLHKIHGKHLFSKIVRLLKI